MKRFVRIVLIVVCAIVVAGAAAVAVYEYRANRKESVAYRQAFPDGASTLVISYVGRPIFPYGEDRIKISVQKGKKTVFDTLVFVANDGARGLFSVDWEDGMPLVTLSGDEMDDIVVTVPEI